MHAWKIPYNICKWYFEYTFVWKTQGHESNNVNTLVLLVQAMHMPLPPLNIFILTIAPTRLRKNCMCDVKMLKLACDSQFCHVYMCPTWIQRLQLYGWVQHQSCLLFLRFHVSESTNHNRSSYQTKPFPIGVYWTKSTTFNLHQRLYSVLFHPSLWLPPNHFTRLILSQMTLVYTPYNEIKVYENISMLHFY